MTVPSTDDAKPTNYVYVATVVASYWIISISMVYLNKIVLSGQYSIPAPIFVTWFQCFITCIICVVLGEIAQNQIELGKVTFLQQFPRVFWRKETAILPALMRLSLIFVGMITFNNVCIQHVHVSFYNVARCLSLVFNVIFTYYVLGKSTDKYSLATLSIVILGFYIGIDGELDFSLFGTLAGVIASIFVALNGIYTSKALEAVGGNKSILLFYNNVNACILFTPLVFIFEFNVLMEHKDTLLSPTFWLCMTICGVFGFSIGLVTAYQIQATSPLTHNISGTAKAAAQSLLAFYIWGNQATFKGVLGILLTIFGSGFYALVQMPQFLSLLGVSKEIKTDSGASK